MKGAKSLSALIFGYLLPNCDLFFLKNRNLALYSLIFEKNSHYCFHSLWTFA
jgi:hypothetical protein